MATESEVDETIREVHFQDDDICTAFELEHYFQHNYKIHDETEVAFEGSYVLGLAKDDSLTCLAAGLSDGSVRLFDISSERGLYITAPRSRNFQTLLSICGVRFLDESPNHLLVGTTNGLIRLIDLRTQSEVARFEYLPRHPVDIASFDRNSNSRLLCVGTDAHKDEAFMLFYDIRAQTKINVYSECHTGDVTTLKFHPQNPDLLCSGSIDGLINIFDLKEKYEDDALLTTINTESSVQKVNWHENDFANDVISCITNANDCKFYEFDGDLISEFDRAEITKTIKRKSVENIHLIDCHNTADGSIFLLTESYFNKGEILRSLRFKNKELLPLTNFEGNKQIVRESLLDIKSNVLVTGGEKGIVTLWTPQTSQLSNPTNSDSSKFKDKRKTSHKVTPY